MAERDPRRPIDTAHGPHVLSQKDPRRDSDRDWHEYDAAVRRGPAIARVARGDFHPHPDSLAEAGVRGFGDGDSAEHWGRGGSDAQGSWNERTGNASRDRGFAGTQGDYAPVYNMPQDVRSDVTWGGSPRLNRSDGVERPRGPKGYVRSDERIREDLCEHLMDIGSVDLSDVEVRVTQGHVILEGTVPERAMRYALEDIAASTSGVTDVENNVRVPRPEPDDTL